MDAIAPALVGLGIWFCFEAWTTSDPHPIAKITAALGGSGPPAVPASNYAAAGQSPNAAPVTTGNLRTAGAT